MFIAYEVALDVVRSLRLIVPQIERQDRDLADQIKRAASSVVLNLAEGQRLTKGNKPKHYAIAHGSANEVLAAVQTAIAWGWIEDADLQLKVLDRLLAILWRLNHPAPPRG
jgi:four helix bundle protein